MTILYTAKKKALAAFTSASLLHTLHNPNAYGTSANDNFGTSVDMSGNFLVVGAPRTKTTLVALTQEKPTSSMPQPAACCIHCPTPNAYRTSANDYFGHSVAISGNYAIVGAYGEDDAGGFESGKAYIFDVTTGSLLHTLSNPNAYGTSANDRFGMAVAISGNLAVIGACLEDYLGSGSGSVYVYQIP